MHLYAAMDLILRFHFIRAAGLPAVIPDPLEFARTVDYSGEAAHIELICIFSSSIYHVWVSWFIYGLFRGVTEETTMVSDVLRRAREQWRGMALDRLKHEYCSVIVAKINCG